MWSEKMQELAISNRHIKIGPPAQDADIQRLRDVLGEIPEELVSLLKEINGDSYFFLSVEQIIETNMALRAMDVFMPLDCLLFFAGNGCGDYYGYQIRKDGISPDNIFFWDHEYDNRIWVANSPEQLCDRYFNSEI
jgi:hypothetical protein